MPFKMPERTKETFRGLALITKAKKGDQRYWKIVLTTGKDEDQKVIETYIKPEKAPAYLFAGHWRITLSQDKTTIFSAVPSDAVVKAQFKDVWHREGEEPSPQTNQGKFGPYLTFSVLWEVVEGEFKGVEVSQQLSYNFEMMDYNGKTIAGYSSTKMKSDRTAMLDAVLSSLGVLGIGDDEKPMPWKDNLLPVIRKRAIAAREEHGLKSLLTISNGWIIAVKPVADSGGGWDEDEGDYNPAQPEPEEAKVEETEETTETSDDEIPWDTEE